MRGRALTLVTVGIALAIGCVHAPRVLSPGRQPYVFWPPPPSDAVVEEPLASVPPTLGDAAALLAARLREDGYTDLRWYPIGASYEHGFAVATRLERVGSSAERWAPLYPDPVELRWLELVKQPTLTSPGYHRALVVGFTDLPAPGSGAAPRWDESTVMETGVPPAVLPASRATGRGFRLLTFRYDYASRP